MNEQIKQTVINNNQKLIDILTEELNFRKSHKFFLSKLKRIENQREIFALEIEINAKTEVLNKLKGRL